METDFSDGVRLILLTGCLEVRSTGFVFEVLLLLSLIDWVLFFISGLLCSTVSVQSKTNHNRGENGEHELCVQV